MSSGVVSRAIKQAWNKCCNKIKRIYWHLFYWSIYFILMHMKPHHYVYLLSLFQVLMLRFRSTSGINKFILVWTDDLGLGLGLVNSDDDDDDETKNLYNASS